MGTPNGLFVITGPPGSGKTPLLRALVDLGFEGVPEPAREVIAEQRAIDGEGLYDRNPALFLELMLQRAIGEHASKVDSPATVFFDRGVPDLIGYAEIFGLDPADAAAAATSHRYHDVVFVLPSWEEIYVTDGDRRMTFDHARRFGDRVSAIYADLGYTLVPVPRDTVQARTAFIVDAIHGTG